MSFNTRRILTPQERRAVEASARRAAGIGSWRVLHACEYVRDVIGVLEGQVAAGMRPYVVTPAGSGAAETYLRDGEFDLPRPLSLLRAWQDVRNWRKSLLDCEPGISVDLVHTHAFAAGMAAVRSCSCVVYDFKACIEELAMAAGQCEPGSWMARSFRVAEQFILSRSSAVVVHSNAMKSAAEERGAAADSTFVIPDPISDLDDSPLTGPWERENGGEVQFFIPRLGDHTESRLGSADANLLEAFALATHDCARLKLEVVTPPELRREVEGHALRLGINNSLALLPESEANRALMEADVVLVGAEAPADPVAARYPNRYCVQAMKAGKALLAADVPRNRDATDQGLGCLWFDPMDARDIGRRMVFLAANPDFRQSLGSAGRRLIVDTRSAAAVGASYDRVYRLALARRKPEGPAQRQGGLQPVECW